MHAVKSSVAATSFSVPDIATSYLARPSTMNASYSYPAAAAAAAAAQSMYAPAPQYHHDYTDPSCRTSWPTSAAAAAASGYDQRFARKYSQ